MQFATSKEYRVVEVCEETVSGNADADERHGLRRVEELAEGGKIKKVLVHEISRIARGGKTGTKWSFANSAEVIMPHAKLSITR